MANSKGLYINASYSSLYLKGFETKAKSLKDISQIKHINRIRKCSGKNLKSHQDTNIESFNNQSFCSLNDHYNLHLRNSSLNSIDFEEKTFINEKMTSSEHKFKFQESNCRIKNDSLKLLKVHKDYWNSNQAIQKQSRERSTKHQSLYDVHQMKHISRIRSVSNKPVSSISCKASDNGLAKLNHKSKNETCSHAHSGDSSEQLKTCNKKVLEVPLTVLETVCSEAENLFINQKQSNATSNLVKDVKESQHSPIQSRINLESNKTATSTNSQQKLVSSQVSNNLKNYRENIASKLRKINNTTQDVNSYGKLEDILQLSKNIRNKNIQEYERKLLLDSGSSQTYDNVANNKQFKNEKKIYLNNHSPNRLSSGSDSEIEILISSVSAEEVSKRSNRKRKTWASSSRKNQENKTSTNCEVLTKRSTLRENASGVISNENLTKLDNINHKFQNSFKENFTIDNSPDTYYFDQSRIVHERGEFEDVCKENIDVNNPPKNNYLEQNVTASANDELGNICMKSIALDQNRIVRERGEFEDVCKENIDVNNPPKNNYLEQNVTTSANDELGNICMESFSMDSPPKEDYPDQKPVFDFPKVKIIELLKEIDPDDFNAKLNVQEIKIMDK